MTYYELVSYLDKMINNISSDDHIDVLNQANINLSGDRYYRFISQVNYLLTQRLKNLLDVLLDRCHSKNLSKEELTSELSRLTEEVNYLKKIIDINLIKNENRNEFIKSIIKNNNEIIDVLLEFYIDEEYKNIILGYKLKEEENEL